MTANTSPREAVDRAIGAVLFNASNFPEKVQSRIPGQDMGPLRQKLTATVLTALGICACKEDVVCATCMTSVFEYRAIACEPDTGDIYESTPVYPSATEALRAASDQSIAAPMPDLPGLVVSVERRQVAGPWQSSKDGTL